jgi:hypothetical protein
MPFKSKSQLRACFAKKDKNWDCHKWAHEGKTKGLPEKKKMKESEEGEEVQAPKIPSFGEYVQARDSQSNPEPEAKEPDDEEKQD